MYFAVLQVTFQRTCHKLRILTRQVPATLISTNV